MDKYDIFRAPDDDRNKKEPTKKKTYTLAELGLYSVLTLVVITVLLIVGTIATSDMAHSEVVEIEVKIDDVVGAYGTGTVIWDGYVVTSYHVVNYSGAVIQIDTNKQPSHRVAKIVASDPINDLAILSTDTSGLKKYSYSLKTEGVGTAIGFLDELLHYNVSSYNSVTYTTDLEYRGSLYEGQSGGALVDTDTGSVVGIIKAIQADPETCRPVGGLVVPMSKVVSLYDSLNKSVYSIY